MTVRPWICDPCRAGDCRGCDIVDGRRAMLRLPVRPCACPYCGAEDGYSDHELFVHEDAG